ncbi:Rev protein [Simian immunodeficiency virus]|uniref:Protein Rev n=1 Tax=Simian immunodeficiency virus TaxID=11723 RepID=Q9WPP1_SIV|nr:Rev protein [Simian immunodeficiency virus]
MSTGDDSINQYLRISKRLYEGLAPGNLPQTHRQRRRRRDRERKNLHQLRAVQERIFATTLDSRLGRAFERLSVSDSSQVAESLGNSPSTKHLPPAKFLVAPTYDFLPSWATPLADPQRLAGFAPYSGYEQDQERVQNQQGESIIVSEGKK